MLELQVISLSAHRVIQFLNLFLFSQRFVLSKNAHFKFVQYGFALCVSIYTVRISLANVILLKFIATETTQFSFRCRCHHNQGQNPFAYDVVTIAIALGLHVNTLIKYIHPIFGRKLSVAVTMWTNLNAFTRFHTGLVIQCKETWTEYWVIHWLRMRAWYIPVCEHMGVFKL